MKAYVCIGGPLDGKFATTKDFLRERVKTAGRPLNWRKIQYTNPQNIDITTIRYPTGRFAEYSHEYHRYNSGGRSAISMVWIHHSLLQKPVYVGK